MTSILKNSANILSSLEKKKAIQLIFLDVITSLLDIGFLIWLLFLVNFFTNQPQKKSYSMLLGMNMHSPFLIFGVFFLLFTAKNFFVFHIMKQQVKFVYGVASRLSAQNIEQYLEGNYLDYVNTDSSVFIHKTSEQPIQFAHYVLSGIQQIISQSVLILFSIAAVLIYNPVLFLMLLLILVPSVMTVAFFMKKKLSETRNQAKPLSEKTIQHLKEALSAFVESNVYQKRDFFSKRYSGAQAKFNDLLSDQLVIRNIPSRLIEVFMVFGLGMLVVIESLRAASGSTHLIIIGAFVAAAYKIIPGIVKIMAANSQIKGYSFTVGELMRSQKRPEKKIAEIKNPFHITTIELSSVSYSYGDKKILHNFSCIIPRGEMIGLSGLSGKGKTTLINLLLGFLSPHQGCILVNDKVCNLQERQNLWKNTSYVKQQPMLIHDTVLKNITLDNEECDHKRLEEVLQVTGLKSLLQDNNGFNKMITENGKNLSGGQRQRIAIARALYKNAEVIILDEPFSELDKNSEEMFVYYFRQLAISGKIVLLITHKKESLSFCHKTISLDEKKYSFTGDFNARLSGRGT
jgi:ABC-type multidrug transport system fused ATPase/permease subunit